MASICSLLTAGVSIYSLRYSAAGASIYSLRYSAAGASIYSLPYSAAGEYTYSLLRSYSFHIYSRYFTLQLRHPSIIHSAVVISIYSLLCSHGRGIHLFFTLQLGHPSILYRTLQLGNPPYSLLWGIHLFFTLGTLHTATRTFLRKSQTFFHHTVLLLVILIFPQKSANYLRILRLRKNRDTLCLAH